MIDRTCHTPEGNELKAVQELFASGERLQLNSIYQLHCQQASTDPQLRTDEIAARSKGMLVHLAEQLAQARRPDCAASELFYQQTDIFTAVMMNKQLVCYCYALALEYHYTKTLESEMKLDPLLSSLLLEVSASSELESSYLATATIAAQARYLKQMERMQLPLTELPVNLLDCIVRIGLEHPETQLLASNFEEAVRSRYSEEATRSSLLKRLVATSSWPRKRRWHLEKAGLSLFIAELSNYSELSFEKAVLLLCKRKVVQLALLLREAGCSAKALHRNLTLLHDEDSSIIGHIVNLPVSDMTLEPLEKYAFAGSPA